ncbi:MAG: lipid-A-disaccharide synthase N-terminal domain-containing protein [Desulfobacterales bacterium]|nr:lipid-A-disaccharide synthase N-terminal domain-containing protein [Desulfobacterales bacterium]
MNTFWLCLGFAAQALFSARFLIQWVASEKAGKSVIPNLFWHFSLFGSGLLLIYSIYRRDPVFIIGQASGIIIYTRNLYFIRREKRNIDQGRENLEQKCTL